MVDNMQRRPTGVKMDTAKQQSKRSGERYMDNRIQVQLEEDGGGSTRQLDGNEWSVAYKERQGITK